MLDPDPDPYHLNTDPKNGLKWTWTRLHDTVFFTCVLALIDPYLLCPGECMVVGGHTGYDSPLVRQSRAVQVYTHISNTLTHTVMSLANGLHKLTLMVIEGG